jgi:hypothetical protein
MRRAVRLVGNARRGAVLGVLTLACGTGDGTGPGAGTGTAIVHLQTTGTVPAPDGYLVQLDALAPQAVGPNDSIRFRSLANGQHQVTLTGVASNCVVVNGDPQTFSVEDGGVADVEFTVTCGPVRRGVVVTVFAPDGSPAAVGMAAQLDSGAERPLDAAGTATFSEMQDGNHRLTILGIPPRCATSESNPRGFYIAGDTLLTLAFHVACLSLPRGRLLAGGPRSGGPLHVYVVDTPGGAATDLTPGSDGAHARWSPDGAWIAFSSARGGAVDAVYVMRADGSAVRRLSPGSGSYPSWSPDGARVLFAGVDGWYIVGLDGASLQKVGLPAGAADVTWSPDGSSVAYVLTQQCTPGYAAPPCTVPLYVSRLDGSGATEIVASASVAASQPAWSPDGHAIAFVRDAVVGGGPLFPCWQRDLVIVRLGAGGTTSLAGYCSFLTAARGRLVDSPVWSPDGSIVAFGHDSALAFVSSDGGPVVSLPMGTPPIPSSWR